MAEPLLQLVQLRDMMQKTDLRHIFFKGINILGSTQGTRAELEQGLYWMSQGKIKSIIDSVYSLEQAAEAHKKNAYRQRSFWKNYHETKF